MTNVIDTVANALPANGEKFTDADVTSNLHEAGLAYLKDYNGNFAYLLDLKTRNPNKLSIGQVRGILNCIKAEITRQANVKADVAVIGVKVADGRYATPSRANFGSSGSTPQPKANGKGSHS